MRIAIKPHRLKGYVIRTMVTMLCVMNFTSSTLVACKYIHHKTKVGNFPFLTYSLVFPDHRKKVSGMHIKCVKCNLIFKRKH